MLELYFLAGPTQRFAYGSAENPIDPNEEVEVIPPDRDPIGSRRVRWRLPFTAWWSAHPES